MFTGIVDHCGKISAVENSKGVTRFTITCAFNDLKEGESIMVDGACLTVIQPAPNTFLCEVSPETKRLTMAAQYCEGSIVNLERALLLSDRIGGHFVSGHVDQTAIVTHVHPVEEFIEMTVGGITSDHRRWLLKKGSIAINGVSLTINALSSETVTVMLIPHTLQKTNLPFIAKEDRVNVEFDWMAKLVSQQIEDRITAYEK